MNSKGVAQNSFDAIVIGSGISGGWAAKELCEKGLKTLVLERGRQVEHLKDYPTASKIHGISSSCRQNNKLMDENPITGRCYAFDEATQHFCEGQRTSLRPGKPFDWIRGYQVGGKSLIWARATQRWSRFEFEAPGRDGFAVDWPIRYEDLHPGTVMWNFYRCEWK